MLKCGFDIPVVAFSNIVVRLIYIYPIYEESIYYTNTLGKLQERSDVGCSPKWIFDDLMKVGEFMTLMRESWHSRCR
jgi:hypothetical protein